MKEKSSLSKNVKILISTFTIIALFILGYSYYIIKKKKDKEKEDPEKIDDKDPEKIDDKDPKKIHQKNINYLTKNINNIKFSENLDEIKNSEIKKIQNKISKENINNIKFSENLDEIKKVENSSTEENIIFYKIVSTEQKSVALTTFNLANSAYINKEEAQIILDNYAVFKYDNNILKRFEQGTEEEKLSIIQNESLLTLYKNKDIPLTISENKLNSNNNNENFIQNQVKENKN